MSKALRLLAAAASLCGLAACGTTVALTPHDGGQPAFADGLWSKERVAVRVDGKVYRGALRQAGPLDLRGVAAAPTRASIAVGRYYGQHGAGGQQIAELTAEDGSRIDCRFSYEPGDAFGSGLCRSDAGRSFSFTLR